MEKRWISPKICSERLGIHLKTCYSKIACGQIPSSRLGGVILVDWKKLEEILEENEKVPIGKKIEEWGI